MASGLSVRAQEKRAMTFEEMVGWEHISEQRISNDGKWVFCKMEYLMENLHNMDLKGFATTIVGLYVAAMVIYLGFLYGVYSFRYQAAKKSVGAYSHTLQKISGIYAKEEKMKDAGSLTEEMDHDGTT